ncbi:MAG: permease prefix domain 1-containing protein [Actinomycetota bacterium]|nr:permease prefix domain 1-containing protein [Actinomycetota bacterium]
MADIHPGDGSGRDVTIDSYLGELERRLPRVGCRRILAEAQEHLRDSAATHRDAGLAPAEAEAAAVADFGPVEIVARQLAAERALRDTRISAIVALSAVGLFVFPLYVVPENSLPPAPWVEKPRDIAVLQLVSVATWLVAGALAAAGAALAWTRWSRLAALVLVTVSVTIAVAAAVVGAITVRWVSYTPATPNWPLSTALAFGCLLASALCAGWALAHRRLLIQG